MIQRPADLSAAALTGSAPYVRRPPATGVPWVAPLVKRPKPRSRSAYRTRSKRWRAGSRRARNQVAAAARLGLPHPLAKPWSGGQHRGSVVIIDETRGWRPGGQ